MSQNQVMSTSEFYPMVKPEVGNGNKTRKPETPSKRGREYKKKKDGEGKDPSLKKKSATAQSTGKNGETKGKRGRKSLASTGGISSAEKKRKHEGEKKSKKHDDETKRTRASPKREQENEGAEALLSLASLAALAEVNFKKDTPWESSNNKKDVNRFPRAPSPANNTNTQNPPSFSSNGGSSASAGASASTGLATTNNFSGKFSILDLVTNDSNQQNIAPQQSQVQSREQRTVAQATSSTTPAATSTSLPQANSAIPFTRPFKRCATHVWIAYHIYYMQRQQAIAQAQAQAPDLTMISPLQSTNSAYPQKYMMPLSLDPTLEARLLKERADQHKRKAGATVSSPNSSSTIFNGLQHTNAIPSSNNINSMMNMPSNSGPNPLALLHQQQLLQMQLQQAHAAASGSQFSNQSNSLQQFQQQNLMTKFPLQFPSQQGSTPSPQMQAQFAQQIQSQLVLLQQTNSVPPALNQFSGFSQLPNNFNYLMQQQSQQLNPTSIGGFPAVGQNQQGLSNISGIQNSIKSQQDMLMRGVSMGLNNNNNNGNGNNNNSNNNNNNSISNNNNNNNSNTQPIKDTMAKNINFPNNLPGISDLTSKAQPTEQSRDAQRPTVSDISKTVKEKKTPDPKSIIDLASEEPEIQPKPAATSTPHPLPVIPSNASTATKESFEIAATLTRIDSDDEEEEEKGMEIIDDEEKDPEDKPADQQSPEPLKKGAEVSNGQSHETNNNHVIADHPNANGGEGKLSNDNSTNTTEPSTSSNTTTPTEPTPINSSAAS